MSILQLYIFKHLHHWYGSRKNYVFLKNNFPIKAAYLLEECILIRRFYFSLTSIFLMKTNCSLIDSDVIFPIQFSSIAHHKSNLIPQLHCVQHCPRSSRHQKILASLQYSGKVNKTEWISDGSVVSFQKIAIAVVVMRLC